MSFSPVIPFGGHAGWAFLARTREAQQAAFDSSGKIARDVDYFTGNIGRIRSAEQLMDDRRLLGVALGAFGLDEDIGNRFFIRKVLEDGTMDPGALANRLSDRRYHEMSRAFGFGDFATPRTVLSDFGAEITSAFRKKQFERAVGAQNPDMRLALGLDDALGPIAARNTTDDGRWFAVMGQTPVRAVFEKALGLPASVGALDLDRQVGIFRERTAALFGGDGEVAQFADPARRGELRRLFLARTDGRGASGALSGASAALSLLQSSAGTYGGLAGRV